MESAALNEYLHQLEKYLPPWKAKEITEDLRSQILDQAETMAEEKGTGVEEQDVREVLQKMGPAERLASQYHEPFVLIRPEYSLHIVIYSVLLMTIHHLWALFGFIRFHFLANTLLDIGIVFTLFLILSRSSKIYSIPLWLPGIGSWKWTENLAAPFKSSTKDFQKRKEILSPSALQEKPMMQQPQRKSFYDRFIETQGPRPLGFFESFWASLNILLGAGFMIYFLVAPNSFPILDLNYFDPGEGWNLSLAAPGISQVRFLAEIAAGLWMVASLVWLLKGYCRINSLISLLFSATAIAFLISLYTLPKPFLSLHFKTEATSLQREADLVLQNIEPWLPLTLLILAGLFALQMAGSLMKLNFLNVWHRRQKEEQEKKQKEAAFQGHL